MAPIPESQPSSCDYPFTNTSDTTFLVVYLVDWVVSAILMFAIFLLIADANCSIMTDQIPWNLPRGSSPTTKTAEAKLRYRVSIGVTVALVLFWAAQAFIVRGAEACAEKGLIGKIKWAPWVLFGLQGTLVVVCVGAVVFLNRAWHKEERREAKGKGRAVHQGSSGVMTPADIGEPEQLHGVSTPGEDGMELQAFQESLQTEYQAPVQQTEDSQTNQGGPEVSVEMTSESPQIERQAPIQHNEESQTNQQGPKSSVELTIESPQNERQAPVKHNEESQTNQQGLKPSVKTTSESPQTEYHSPVQQTEDSQTNQGGPEVSVEMTSESPQIERQAPIQHNEESQTNQRGPVPSVKTTSKAEPEPEPKPEGEANNLRVRQQSERAGYARTVSKMTLAIQKGSTGLPNNIGEGSSKEVAQNLAANTQGYPFPIIPKTSTGSRVRQSAPTSPKLDSGVAWNTEEEEPLTIGGYFRRLLAAPESPLVAPYSHAERETAILARNDEEAGDLKVLQDPRICHGPEPTYNG